MKRLVPISIVVVLIPLMLSSCFSLPEDKITVKVVSEDGAPLSGEEVSVSFTAPAGLKQGIKVATIKGFTDSEGLYIVTHRMAGDVGCAVQKDGYYDSRGNYSFHQEEKGKWLPWNPEIRLVVRRIENPVPMYARDTLMSRLDIPVAGKQVGFDLIEYDWVPPYGKGKHADFVFKLDKNQLSNYEYEASLTITFSNKHDGIQLLKESRSQGSLLKLPRFAPETGYQNNIVRSINGIPGQPMSENYQKDNNYIFRVRSEEGNGKLYRAMYGKIQGDIRFNTRRNKTAAIVFVYFLNPDYSKNLEYGGNLFRNLNDTEKVAIDQ